MIVTALAACPGVPFGKCSTEQTDLASLDVGTTLPPVQRTASNAFIGKHQRPLEVDFSKAPIAITIQ